MVTGSLLEASSSLRFLIPVPASKISLLLSASISTQAVLPPYFTVVSTGVGIDPLVP